MHAVKRTGQPGLRLNYEPFNCNNFYIRYWSWNYGGCWLFNFFIPSTTEFNKITQIFLPRKYSLALSV